MTEAARKLRRRYVEGLPAKWRVLEDAIAAMVRGEHEEAETTLRRLAHQLRGTAASFGFTAVDRMAFRLEYAEHESEVLAAAGLLVTELRTAYASEALATAQVLLIDDDLSIGFIIKALLIEENLVVTQVTTAAVAQQELELADWSMLIVDLVLPDADGRTLLTKIRNLPLHRDTPLVVISVKTGSLVKNECSMYGIDAFIEKPIDAATFAVSIAGILGRTRSLQAAAFDDGLTNLPNRVGFRRAFEPLCQAAGRNHQPLTLALLDVDHFKQFNDTYGHHVGDQTLQLMARTLEQTIPDALIGRWGGEEFIVAMANAESFTALSLLEKAAQALRDQPVAGQVGIALTFSAGVTQVESGESLDLALLRADQLLYQAKRTGRARVAHVFEPATDGRPKLLIAEDDPEVASLLLHDLAEDFDITHAIDGLAALAVASRITFDLVLLDYQMPGRNGLEVVRTLREWPQYAHKPILLLTAVGNDSAIEAAFEAGADDYISKPHRRRSLLARLNRHLGRAPSAASKPARVVATSIEADVTALFCDISGFTSLASRMTPHEVVALLNEYFPLIAQVVVRHEGSLEKYVGDALLAVWGANSSVGVRDDAMLALTAAVEIQQVVRRLAATTSPAIAVHIGLNSGPVAVGNIGSGPLTQYATIGSATNLASRVCDVAGPGQIALGATTFERLAGGCPWPLTGPAMHTVKGFEEPIAVYLLSDA